MKPQNNRTMSEEESLKRSHSAWSNTKLTALCVITIIAISAFWVSLALLQRIGTIGFMAAGVTGIVSVLCLIGFNKFKR